MLVFVADVVFGKGGAVVLESVLVKAPSPERKAERSKVPSPAGTGGGREGPLIGSNVIPYITIGGADVMGPAVIVVVLPSKTYEFGGSAIERVMVATGDDGVRR